MKLGLESTLFCSISGWPLCHKVTDSISNHYQGNVPRYSFDFNLRYMYYTDPMWYRNFKTTLLSPFVTKKIPIF
jgi:hypothetical protein